MELKAGWTGKVDESRGGRHFVRCSCCLGAMTRCIWMHMDAYGGILFLDEVGPPLVIFDGGFDGRLLRKDGITKAKG